MQPFLNYNIFFWKVVFFNESASFLKIKLQELNKPKSANVVSSILFNVYLFHLALLERF